MEDKNSFDDIILEKSNKSEKIKKLLLRIMALVILFLVVIIIMKLFNSENSSSTQGLVSEQNTIASQTQNEDTTLGTQIIANDNTESNFEDLKKQLLGNEENTSINEQNTSGFLFPPVPEETQNTAQAEVLPPPPSTNTQVPANKPTPSKPNDTKVKDLFETAPKQTGELEAGTYVQIFSVSKFDPKSKELALIKQNGYEYKLYKTKVNNNEVTRVLIGPFSRDKLNAELSKIREKIKKDAFTFQVK